MQNSSSEVPVPTPLQVPVEADATAVTVYWVFPELHTWRVLREGVDRAIGTFALKDDAVDRARGLALSRVPSLVKVQDFSGRITAEYNYGAVFLAQTG